jgi:hypothetical protein
VSLFRRRLSGCRNLAKQALKLVYKPLKKILTKINKVLKPIQNAVKNIGKAIRRFFGRRKREIDQPFTCEIIRSMSSSVTTLESTDIESMTDDEFLKCIEQFGKYYDYSNDALISLKSKLLSSLQLSNMTAVNDEIITKLGHLASSFDASEIVYWNINKMDTISSLRELNMTSSQVNIFEKFQNITGYECGKLKY